MLECVKEEGSSSLRRLSIFMDAISDVSDEAGRKLDGSFFLVL